MATAFTLTDATFRSPRHTTHYWEAGPAGGPLMIFLHGWPQIGLVWRGQVEAFASEGWHCIAPDMRGYGGSSAPTAPEAYALKEIVDDMIELHNHLGAGPAIWAAAIEAEPDLRMTTGPTDLRLVMKNAPVSAFPARLGHGIPGHWPTFRDLSVLKTRIGDWRESRQNGD